MNLVSHPARGEGLGKNILWPGKSNLGVTQRFLFQRLLHQGVEEGVTSFPGLLHFTLDPYLIKLSVKQGGS